MSLFEVSSTWLDERYARCYVWAATPEQAREVGGKYLHSAWGRLRSTSALQVVTVFPLRQHYDYPLIMDAEPEQKTERSDYEAFCAFFGVMGVEFQPLERIDANWIPIRKGALEITVADAHFWFDKEGAYLGVNEDAERVWMPRKGKESPCQAEGS